MNEVLWVSLEVVALEFDEENNCVILDILKGC